MVRKISSGAGEPSGITPEINDYASALSRAFNFYHQDKDKKDARLYLKAYVKHKDSTFNVKVIDSTADNKISLTLGWCARIISNGNTLAPKHINELDLYLKDLSKTKVEEVVVVVKEKINRPTIQDYMQDKISEVLGEMEGVIDNFIKDGNTFDLYSHLKANSIPRPYCSHIEEWTKRKAREFIQVHQETDKEARAAYLLTNKQLVQLIKMLGQFLQDLEKFSQFKKANRKPKVTKVKPPIVQVAKLKYKKIDEALNLKSANPAEMVGASQVWVYNCKYKKLAVYRSDAPQGIQVKGTALQNYQPELSEQKSLRKPAETIKYLLSAGKIQLRKIISDLTTKQSDVSGRLNEDCIIVRVIR